MDRCVWATVESPASTLRRCQCQVELAWLFVGSGVMVRMSCHQCRDEGAQEGFAAAPGVVHKLKEAEV